MDADYADQILLHSATKLEVVHSANFLTWTKPTINLASPI